MPQRIVVFYIAPDGKRVVDAEIADLQKADISRVLRAIQRLEDYGEFMPRRFARHVLDKIWELKEDRLRVLYFTFIKDKFVVLRVFMKKTQKTPNSEVRIAERRMQDYIQRHSV